LSWGATAVNLFGKKSLFMVFVLLIALFLCGAVSASSTTTLNTNKTLVSGAYIKDLVVTDISIPKAAIKGQKISVPNRIKNIGNRNATGFWVNYYLKSSYSGSKKYIGHRYITGLKAGTSNYQHTILTIPRTMGTNAYYILAYTDSTRIVRETNESNNVRYSSTKINVGIHAYWINTGTDELNHISVKSLKNSGVTDLFVLIDKNNPEGSLKPYVKAFSGSGIKLHAWINCFKSDGKWFDPADAARTNILYKKIITIAYKYNIDGIHLDYVRYPGTAYKYSHPADTITNFVKRVYTNIQYINRLKIHGKHTVLLSAALMPECGSNSYYYGQDYTKLAPYLNYLMPMIYKGNYHQNTNWIGTTTKYIVAHACGRPVIAGLLNYHSETNYSPLSSSELSMDIKTAIYNGSFGYVLFKYGMG
jgi:hypothetical protein